MLVAWMKASKSFNQVPCGGTVETAAWIGPSQTGALFTIGLTHRFVHLREY